MVSPIDYTLDVVNPFQSAMQGFANGQQIMQNAELIKAKRAEEEQKQQALIQQQVRQEALYNFSNIPNKTAEDYSNIINRFPDLAESYQKSWNMLNGERQQQTLSIASQVYESLRNGAPNIAKDILGEQIKGLENSGMKREAINLRGILNTIDTNPKVAQANLGMLMSSVAPEHFKNITDARNANEMQSYDVAKKQAETGKIRAETQGQYIENQFKPQQLQSGINQTQSQTALNFANIQNMADRLKLDKDRLQTDAEFKFMELNPSNVKLSDGAIKLVNDSVLASTASEQMAAQQESLANNIEAQGGGYGLFSGLSERLAKATGSQDAMTELRNEYTRIRNSAAIKSLPPGPATDKDIELALKGMPPETADSKTIASFLRGMAKLNKRDAAYQQMQAEWANQVGHMGSSKRDVEVMGVRVPAGMNFGTYASKNLNRALKQQSNQAIDRQIATGQRSYMSAVQ
ncbi:hypothetical protein SB581_12015 [Acinetobacter baumannii]|nr:hypothetical protein SB581_12015 [Acinetobacter baumannii]